MALVVEDNTGLPDAESFVSVADADTYFTNRGDPSEWSSLSVAEKEANLRVAAEYLKNEYAGSWKGSLFDKDQRLPFPRLNLYNAENILIEDVPTEIIDANCELALLNVNNSLRVGIVNDKNVKSRSVRVDTISEEVEFVGASNTKPVYPYILSMISQYLKAGSISGTGGSSTLYLTL